MKIFIDTADLSEIKEAVATFTDIGLQTAVADAKKAAEHAK